MALPRLARPEFNIGDLRSRKPDIETIVDGDGVKTPDLDSVDDNRLHRI